MQVDTGRVYIGMTGATLKGTCLWQRAWVCAIAYLQEIGISDLQPEALVRVDVAFDFFEHLPPGSPSLLWRIRDELVSELEFGPEVVEHGYRRRRCCREGVCLSLGTETDGPCRGMESLRITWSKRRASGVAYGASKHHQDEASRDGLHVTRFEVQLGNEWLTERGICVVGELNDRAVRQRIAKYVFRTIMRDRYIRKTALVVRRAVKCWVDASPSTPAHSYTRVRASGIPLPSAIPTSSLGSDHE